MFELTLRSWFKIIIAYFCTKYAIMMEFGSSHPEVFCKKGVLRNFTKFTGKRLCQSLFFNKVAGLRPSTLFKKRVWHRCFPVNFVELLGTPFFKDHLWWLLLGAWSYHWWRFEKLSNFKVYALLLSFLIFTYYWWKKITSYLGN